MALRFDMLVTPMDKTTVTTAASPSGIAATARETAIMKEFRMTSKFSPPARRSCTAKITTQIPSTSHVSILLSCVSFICNGVCPSEACERASAILPISVSMPVAQTIMAPRP